MAKGKPITQDEPTKREVLAAVFFAVRLFRIPAGEAHPEEHRDVMAKRAVLDADALIAAFGASE